MATSPETPAPPPAGQDWLTLLVQRRKEVAYALFAFAVVMIGVGVWVWYQYKWDQLSVIAWAGCLAGVTLFLGIWQLLREPEPGEEPDTTRLLVLGFGGLVGLATACLGVALYLQWNATFLNFFRGEPVDNFWKIGGAVLVDLAGLAVLFGALQLAQVTVRANPLLRWVLYGYNVVLQGNILLRILLLVNVLVFAFLSFPMDFTEASIYSLAPRSQNMLRSLEKPVKVYVLMAQNHRVYDEVTTLLANARQVTDKFQVEYVSPDTDPVKIKELLSRYPFVARQGLLVVYGTEGQSDYRFIPEQDLYEMPFDRESQKQQQLKFKGEDALFTEIDFLASGKVKQSVYVTQGHGELDLNSPDVRNIDVGLAAFRRRIEERNLTVKPLNFGGGDTRVPDDAAVVVVPGPAFDFSEGAVKALQDYMNPTDKEKKPGKLVVFVDLAFPPRKTTPLPNLEKFLAQFNVQVGNERVMSLRYTNPLIVLATPNPQLRERNPVAREFDRVPFEMINVRPVNSMRNPADRMGGSPYQVEPLLIAPPAFSVWTEKDLQMGQDEIARVVKAMRSDGEERAKKLSKDDVPVAVAVTQFVGGEPKGRLVVFGDATLLSNMFMEEGTGNANFELVAGCIDWLRERPSNIGIDPKKRSEYVLDKNFNHPRSVLLPTGLMLLGIVGLGTGVWIVRRR